MTTISILNEKEIIKFDSPPVFSDEQKQIYFSNKDLVENKIELRKDISKIIIDKENVLEDIAPKMVLKESKDDKTA